MAAIGKVKQLGAFPTAQVTQKSDTVVESTQYQLQSTYQLEVSEAECHVGDKVRNFVTTKANRRSQCESFFGRPISVAPRLFQLQRVQEADLATRNLTFME